MKKERDMKRYLTAVAAAMSAAVLLAGCTKEGPSRFKGYYSYSLSGTIELVPEQDAGDTGDGGTAAEETPVVLSVPSESGQMDIVTVDKSGRAMIMTMRPVTGGTVVFDAKADGKTLVLEPATRRIMVNFSDVLLGGEAAMDVEVSGSGEKFVDVVIFRLEYNGTCTHNGVKYRISGSSVDCVAKEN